MPLISSNQPLPELRESGIERAIQIAASLHNALMQENEKRRASFEARRQLRFLMQNLIAARTKGFLTKEAVVRLDTISESIKNQANILVNAHLFDSEIIIACDKYLSEIRELCLSYIRNEDREQIVSLERKKFIDDAIRLISDGLDQWSKNATERSALWNLISAGVVGKADAGVTHKLTSPPDDERYSSHAREGEDAVAFIDRVYGQRGYLTGEFTRADLRKIDPSAAKALYNWEQATKTRPKRQAPLNLPTIAQRNDQLAAADPSTLSHAERKARTQVLSTRSQNEKRRLDKN